MNSIDTTSVTHFTAVAINKATDAINHSHSSNLKMNLRITNIESKINYKLNKKQTRKTLSK